MTAPEGLYPTAMSLDAADWLNGYHVLAERAAAWIRADRSESWLLDESEVEEYERWVGRKPPDLPAPRQVMLDFLRISKELPWKQTYDKLMACYLRWKEAQRPVHFLLDKSERELVPGWLASWPSTIAKPEAEFLSYIEAKRPLMDSGRSSLTSQAFPTTDPLVAAQVKLPPRVLSLDEMKTARARGGAPKQKAASRADAVDVSVFAPSEARPSTKVMVQVLLHGPDEFEPATERATLRDKEAVPRGTSALAIRLRRGARVTIVLFEPSLEINQPVQNLNWDGRLAGVDFIVKLPSADSNLFPTVRVDVDGALVGEVSFKLSVKFHADDRPRNILQGTSPKRHTRAFFSYSSKDRVKVLEIAQSYRAAGVDFFQDVLDLEPGVRWQKGLYQEIDRCDLFLLFWSSAARDSEWVAKEARYALDRQRRSDEHIPTVTPLILEGPPPPAPHEFLKHLHFDDWMRYGISALSRLKSLETKPKSRWWPW